MVQMVLKRSLLTFFLIGAILSSGSCSLLEPGLSVLRGNYLYQQGRYQNALLLYLEGDESGKSRERIHYNIGNVYYALGEGPAALEIWSGQEDSRDADVTYNRVFNSGVIYYQLGSYPDAYRAFRTALELDAGNLDAKRNLELTIDRMEAEARNGETRTESPVPETSDDARRILQYIRRKEGSVWKSESAGSGDANDW